MAQNKNLYFIAIIPHQSIREEVKNLKEEIKDRFQAKHALKSPAHITLQMPFKLEGELETKLIEILEAFATTQSNFEVKLNGFDCFSPRVIFVQVEDHAPIINLHKVLKEVLMKDMGFKEQDITQKVHPHMTLATRDLKKDMFYEAWSEFENRAYKNSFEVGAIYLLKHNGKFWDIYKECKLSV
ncbi:2'-5' RNA ligase family protein [Chondrinema litorale]|uniref:2'-5' RNA ligase family protein n=1 Tax=Chondrinema litorale TaxID=2994555 RepID=UPI002542B467|nr:2'-5' RNA ligase family protein [Chondrinema litorale]UZR92284.1 2'-5' RNA ligase family protein [Chondrinema litorale]